MESQVASRRVNVIAAHLASHADLSATATHVFPMRCSNNLNSVIRRYDSKMYFARQASSTQGYFMRPASREHEDSVQPPILSKSTSCGNMQSTSLDAPAFARPIEKQPCTPSVQGTKPVAGYFISSEHALEAPKFARPARECEQPLKSQFEEGKQSFASKGSEWSPKMDVVESGYNYVIMVEIPGVSNGNIKVEVDNQSLIVTGNRSNWSCGVASSNKSTTYHRREILQGPYHVVWPLPSNANKDSVSAAFQILIVILYKGRLRPSRTYVVFVLGLS